MLDKIKELYIKYKELINYLIVGVLTTVVSLGTYYGCVLTFLYPQSAIDRTPDCEYSIVDCSSDFCIFYKP